MAAPTLPYTLTNGATADATQVQANDNALLNAVTDGSKDLTCNGLTLNGDLSIANSTTIGSSSTDDLTVTASLASTINIKTTFSYDIGSNPLGLKYLFLGSADSAARSTKLAGATIASAYTYTFPTTGGTLGMFKTTNGSGTTSWRYPSKVVSKTTTYTAATDDTDILCDASGAAFTVTLPAASGNSGLTYRIKKTDSDFTKAVTIDGNAAETIDGSATTTLNTQYEAITIVCDGSNWFIQKRTIPIIETAYTPTISWTATSITATGYWWRAGNQVHCNVGIAIANAGALAGGTLTMSLPSGMAVDTTPLRTTASGITTAVLGKGQLFDTSASKTYLAAVGYSSTTVVKALYLDSTAAVALEMGSLTHLVPLTVATNDGLEFSFSVPISGWNV